MFVISYKKLIMFKITDKNKIMKNLYILSTDKPSRYALKK